MTRVTRTLPKLSYGIAFRSISSSATANSRSSFPLNSANARKLAELNNNGSKAELVRHLHAHDITRSQSTMPISSTLMQPNTSHAPSRDDPTAASPVDLFFLPRLPIDEQAVNHFNIRVPILPDNHSPLHTARKPEILDGAVPRPEISVVSHHPEVTIASAMTEVVGNAAVEEDVEVLSRAAQIKQVWKNETAASKDTTMLKQLWNGVLDDVFGSKKGEGAAMA